MSKLLRRILVGLAIVGLLFAIARILQRSTNVIVGNTPQFRKKGNPKASLIILEYSDFQCPACKTAQTQVSNIFDVYKDRALLVFKHLPLEKIHKWARLAARAAECAGEQRKFWQYHDLLYARQQDWAKLDEAQPLFLDYAKELELDTPSFENCLKNQKTNEAINQDIREADVKQINSTPTFFVNRHRLAGPDQLFRHGRRFIEIELKYGPK